MNNKLTDSIEATLAKTLPKASDASIQQLAGLLASPSRQSSLKVITGLLDDGCSAIKLQAALMHGRNVILQDRVSAVSSMETYQLCEEIRKILLHFDRTQTSLIHAIAQHWDQQFVALRSQLVDEGQALMLSKARNTWLKAGCIEFYNYFDEMPVIANADIRDVRDDSISVNRTRELALVIAAGEHQCYAHVRLPNSKLCLRMAVESANHHAVHWKNAGILEIARERRQHIRILCAEHQTAIVKRAHGPKWDVNMRDFSTTGLGLTAKDRLPGKVGDMLHCNFQVRQTAFEFKGVIRWKSEVDSGNARLGLELSTDHVGMQKLQHEVALRQKEVLGRLHIRGTPDCLMHS
jgi:hypothetical protein